MNLTESAYLKGVFETAEKLERARAKLYSISGGSMDSGNVRAARLTTNERIEYFKSPEFRDWVAAEKSHGREVFWLKDVDKTQGAGDIFTFFFKWRADNNKFSPAQLKVLRTFLLSKQTWLSRQVTRTGFGLFGKSGNLTPHDVLRLWKGKEQGGEGINLLDFWFGAYWPSQVGFTKEEKWAQVTEFAASYAPKIYPGVTAENRALTDAGVNVVIVTNGDQELAFAAADTLAIDPRNVVGSRLLYGEDGKATGCNHSYEVTEKYWVNKPQPGKALSFHYWLHTNRGRWGWNTIDERRLVIAGRDGDSASSDGGMMILSQAPAIGNFMVDTPDEPERIQRFYRVAAKYGWTRGQFFTLGQERSVSGRLPE